MVHSPVNRKLVNTYIKYTEQLFEVQSQSINAEFQMVLYDKNIFYENILGLIVELSCDPNSSTFWIPCRRDKLMDFKA